MKNYRWVKPNLVARSLQTGHLQIIFVIRGLSGLREDKDPKHIGKETHG